MIPKKTQLNGKVIAVTGASGYIGSALVSELKKYPVKIIRIGRNKMLPNEKCEDWILDLESFESWKKIVKNVDIVFHLAANTSIYSVEMNPDNNLNSSLNPINHLIEASRKLSVKPKIIFASTATIYGLTTNLPVLESYVPQPITLYDMHKYHAEKKLVNAYMNNLINLSILRLANVYGPSLCESKSKDRGVLSKVTRMAFEGKKLQIYGNGQYLRDYIYIDDVISAFISVVSKFSNEIIFNVSTAKGTKVLDVFNLIIREVEKITKTNNGLELVNWPVGISDIEKRNFIGSNDLLRASSNWCPSVNIESGINLLVSFYSKEYQ